MLRRVTPSTVVLAALALGGGPTIDAGEIGVVASIKPVHALVAGVMEGVEVPALLVKGASSPHDYSMRPSDARALDGAKVVFWIGEELETFLTKPLAALASDARLVELSDAPGVALLATREGGLWGEQERGDADAGTRPEHQDSAEGHEPPAEAPAAHEEHRDEQADAGREHEDEHGQEDEHGHAHGGRDMHLWLDPHNAQGMVGAIVAALSEVDPDHAAIYLSNGNALRAQLHELDESLRARLEPVRDRPFVVFHDAYQYFENRYALNAVGAITVDPRRRPGARRLVEIQQRLAQLDVACVFSEPQFEPALVDIVIEGTGARKGVLDPLGADLDAGPELYFELMDGLADALVGCLGRPQP